MGTLGKNKKMRHAVFTKESATDMMRQTKVRNFAESGRFVAKRVDLRDEGSIETKTANKIHKTRTKNRTENS